MIFPSIRGMGGGPKVTKRQFIDLATNPSVRLPTGAWSRCKLVILAINCSCLDQHLVSTWLF
ncbi:MAG: hypothetical protein WDN69_22790 [Aliidongia sp.]